MSTFRRHTESGRPSNTYPSTAYAQHPERRKKIRPKAPQATKRNREPIRRAVRQRPAWPPTSQTITMTFQQELSSWFAPKDTPEVAPPPSIGSTAPTTPKIKLEPGQPTILTFLRHCGCPFAEKTFLNLRETAKAHKSITFLAISHSDEASTNTWLQSLPQSGSEPSNLHVIVDAECEAYAAWGLGVSGYAHALSPWSLYEVWKLGREEGIWNRPTESGSRWQIGGSFAVDGSGVVRWGRAQERADDVVDFGEGVAAVEGSGGG